MSENKSQANASTLVSIVVTVIAGIILFLISKWFLSFLINHWLLILLVIVVLITGGLGYLFREKE